MNLIRAAIAMFFPPSGLIDIFPTIVLNKKSTTHCCLSWEDGGHSCAAGGPYKNFSASRGLRESSDI